MTSTSIVFKLYIYILLYYYYYYYHHYHYIIIIIIIIIIIGVQILVLQTHTCTHTYIYTVCFYLFIYIYIHIYIYIYIYVDMEIISPGTTSAWASPVWLWPVPWQSSAVLWSLWRCCGVAGCWRQSRRCQRRDWRLMGLFWGYEHMGMDQYLLMPFLVG